MLWTGYKDENEFVAYDAVSRVILYSELLHCRDNFKYDTKDLAQQFAEGRFLNGTGHSFSTSFPAGVYGPEGFIRELTPEEQVETDTYYPRKDLFND